MCASRGFAALVSLGVLLTVTACGDHPAPTDPVSTVTPPAKPVAPPPPAASVFDVQLRFIGDGGTARHREAFARGVARWREIITGDIGDTKLDVPTSECQPWIPAVAETVNDLLVFVRITKIDGVGKVVGQASPCYVNSVTKLPIMGFFELDEEDLVAMTDRGVLDDVVLHELGHVLGIGTLWNYKRTLLVGAGTDDPYFSGEGARLAFTTIGGGFYSGTAVPVENSGREGTRDSHWRATIFGNELMQGFAQPGGMPLSRVTAASLADLGYTVSFTRADGFSFFPALRMGVESGPAMQLGDDIARAPLYEVEPRGSRRLVRPEME